MGLLGAVTAGLMAGPASAAVYNVTDPADAVDANPFDASCQSTLGTCTLRAAIMQANQNPGADEILLAPGVYTIGLGGPGEDAGLGGDFDITDDVTIRGQGVLSAIIDADGLDRVFDIHDGTGSVVFEAMTIRGGNVTQRADPNDNNPSVQGGGIRALGEEVVLDGVLLTRNDAAVGGGLFSRSRVEVLDSRIHQNNALWWGGGIATLGFDSDVAFERSVLWSNASGGDGGGFYGQGQAFFSQSSIYENRAGGNGGGFWTNTGYNATIAWVFENVTFSGNEAKGSGGAAYTSGGIDLLNVTVADNRAGYGGGGIRSNGAGNPAGHSRIENTIVANNTAPNGPDCNGDVTSFGHSLVRSITGCMFTPHASDVAPGTNPLLGGLQFQHTHFYPISHSSAAKDAAANCPVVDQRDVPRPQGPACDIGAYELEFDPDAPVAIDDHYSVPFPGPVSLLPPGVLANDSDPNGDALTATLQYIDPTDGSVTVDPDGGFHFVPGGFLYAERSFSYRAYDGENWSNTAIVTVASGHREWPWTLYEVPEMPWLDPGPYRFDCLAVWRDGTMATQAFGSGSWAGAKPTNARLIRGATSDPGFSAKLTGPDGESIALVGQLDERKLEAIVRLSSGERVAIKGHANPACNVLSDSIADSRSDEIAEKLVRVR